MRVSVNETYVGSSHDYRTITFKINGITGEVSEIEDSVPDVYKLNHIIYAVGLGRYWAGIDEITASVE